MIRTNLQEIYADKIKFFSQKAENWQGINRECPVYHEVYKSINLKHGSKVLDIGCGTGDLFPILTHLGTGVKIIGLDMCKEMLKRAGEFAYPDLKLLHGFCEDIPLPSDYIDVIFINDTLPHFDDRELALEEINRVLCSKGELYLIHSSSCQQVNQTHIDLGHPVNSDLLPPVECIVEDLEKLPLKVKTIKDTDNYLMINALKY